MKIAVILNGISLQKKFFYHQIHPALRASFDVEIFETLSRNDATTLASKAVDKQFDLILAAGGDGTTFQVLNGILEGRARYTDLPTMGVIPIGSGNDFARSLHAPSDPALIVDMIQKNQTLRLDVGQVTFTTNEGTPDQKYFINVADVGMGPQVVKRVLNSGRPFGSEVAYYKSIIATFFSYKLVDFKATDATWSWEGKMRTFAVANGKFYGHGLCIAPDAKMDDGVFHVFACGDASVLDFIIQSVPLKKGKHLDHPKVSYNTTRAIELTSKELCLIEADGELLGRLPARIQMAPMKMKFLRC